MRVLVEMEGAMACLLNTDLGGEWSGVEWRGVWVEGRRMKRKGDWMKDRKAWGFTIQWSMLRFIDESHVHLCKRIKQEKNEYQQEITNQS